jgi:hypothetical protein
LEATVTVLVGVKPLRVRVDWVEQTDTGGDRLMYVAKDSAGHAAQ